MFRSRVQWVAIRARPSVRPIVRVFGAGAIVVVLALVVAPITACEPTHVDDSGAATAGTVSSDGTALAVSPRDDDAQGTAGTPGRSTADGLRATDVMTSAIYDGAPAAPLVGHDAPPTAGTADTDVLSDTISSAQLAPAATQVLAGPDLVAQAAITAQAIQTAQALDAMTPPQLYRTAEQLAASGLTDDAISAFERYAQAEPAMSDVAAMAIGTALFEAGRHNEALTAFTRARDEAGDPTTEFLAALRRGNAVLRIGPAAAALVAYDDAFARAQDDIGRSQAMAGQIAALVDDDRLGEAYEVRRQLVRQMPTTALASGALARLDEAAQAVPLADRAAVVAGSGDHTSAVGLYQQAMDDGSLPIGTGTAAILRSYKAMGQHSNTVAKADAFLAEHPTDTAAVGVAWRRAEALSKLGRDTDAADAYLALVQMWPGHDDAPDALHRRALILESLDGPDVGAAALDELRIMYPRYDGALDVLLRSALLHYRLGNLPQAAERWFAAVDNADPEQQAQAWYWLGKAAAEGGDRDLALQYLRAAANADRDGFYGLRAAQWLGEGLDAPPQGSMNVAEDTAQWLGTWVAGFDRADWDTSRAGIQGARDVARASALLDLDRRPAAGRTLRRALRSASGDPGSVAALAIEATDMGVYDVAIAAASQLLTAAGPVSPDAAPLAVWRLAYPDAYGEQVRAEADRLGVPADLMFALMRQESRFDPTAQSPVGASGLAQVMPGTGAGIAGALGEAGFEVADLLDPDTSVRYGVWYLHQQLDRYEGRDWAALSAYNGGPGNATRWLATSGGDRDLFAEIIDFRETRRYVKLVEEQRAQYERLYADG